MISQAPHSFGSKRDGLAQRLEVYSRYAAVVRAQEEAIQAGDLERFTELGEVRQGLQEELDADSSGEDLEEALGSPEGRALMEQVRTSLQSALARDQRIRKALGGLRGDLAGSLRSMESRRGQVGSYLELQEVGEGRPPPRLNRKG
jgi:hypothetical protein